MMRTSSKVARRPVRLLGAIAVIGIVVAIASPRLVAPRSGNEASAIGALRAINAAQATYAAMCGKRGYAESLSDLAKPPAGGSVAFISPDLNVDGVDRNGYIVSVVPVPRAVRVATGAETCNGTGSMSDYFAVAVPVSVGEAARRSFATDARGRIYFQPSGSRIEPGMTGAQPLQ